MLEFIDVRLVFRGGGGRADCFFCRRRSVGLCSILDDNEKCALVSCFCARLLQKNVSSGDDALHVQSAKVDGAASSDELDKVDEAA